MAPFGQGNCNKDDAPILSVLALHTIPDETEGYPISFFFDTARLLRNYFYVSK